MINDYSEVTAGIHSQIIYMNAMLEQKNWIEAHKVITSLKVNFELLDEFVSNKLAIDREENVIL